MQLVEQHLIRRSDPRYAAIDQAAFASKNLYNQATYQIRQLTRIGAPSRQHSKSGMSIPKSLPEGPSFPATSTRRRGAIS